MVEFHRRSPSIPGKLGILAGSFNPPTIAHFELASAAGFHVDEVLCVVPRAFPHKGYYGATLEQRVDMLGRWELMIPHSIATSDQGLFVDIARECRTHFGSDTRLYLICGRDAAERIFTWDYGRPGVVEEMLGEVELLVAPRGGEFQPPLEFGRRIHSLGLHGEPDHVASSEVRKPIPRAYTRNHLVPLALLYQGRA